MKNQLSEKQREQIDILISETEKQKDTQIVLAIIERSDSYVELPWKAFALGSGFAGFVFIALNFLSNTWMTYSTIILAVTITLSAGAAFALLTIFFPAFAKLFLSEHRTEVEVKQFAESLFYKHELFATRKRNGILLLISLFEQEVILLPDKGLNKTFTKEAMQKVIDPITSLLGQKLVFEALQEGLMQLSLNLEDAVPNQISDSSKNELPNQLIEEKGV